MTTPSSPPPLEETAVKVFIVPDGWDCVAMPMQFAYGDTVDNLLHQLVFSYTDKSADEAGRIAAKLKALHRNTPLKRDSTLWYAGLYDGCFVVVEGLSLRAARRPTASEDPEFVTLDVPLGAVVFRTTESADSLTGAISDLLLDYVPDDARREEIWRQIRFTVADGASAPQAVRERLEMQKETLGAFEGVLGVVCAIHVLHDGFLHICVHLSVPCPAWNRDSHNSVIVYFLEQVSTTLHNHHTALGLDGFVETVQLGMETRWNSYAEVAAAVFVYRRMLRLRLREFLRQRETLNGGGVELDAKARLALWIVLRGARKRPFPQNVPEAGACYQKVRVEKGPRVAAGHGLQRPAGVGRVHDARVLVPVRGLARHRLARDLLDAAERGPESAGDAGVPAGALRSFSGARDGCAGVPTRYGGLRGKQRHGRRPLPRFGLACVAAFGGLWCE